MTLQPRHHQLVRFFAGALTLASVSYMAARSNVRLDATSEGLSKLTPATQSLITGIAAERPVTVHAFISSDVPRDYIPIRTHLMNILREMQAEGGPGLTIRIVEPELHSSEAQEAIDKYGITPRNVLSQESGSMREIELFMGLAFVSGPREEVVPFLDRGLSVEYEIARALRVVTQDKKKVVGILRTDATIMGNFDLQARRQQPAWRIVDELRKQYEVRSLNPKTEIPKDIDVLLVPQLSSCSQEELDHVKAYVDAGRPALLTVDPMPLFDLRVAPSEPKLPPPGQDNGMFGGPPQGGEPKGDYRGFLAHIGVAWSERDVLFDAFNPHPSFAEIPPQVVFVTSRPDGTRPFENADPIVDGLTEVVVLFGGELKASTAAEGEFVPLLSSGTTAGFNAFDDLVSRHMLFGLQGPVPPRKRAAITGRSHVIAARVRTQASAADKKADAGDTGGEAKAASGSGTKRNVIAIADLDLFGNQFFGLYERGGDIDGDGLDDIRFDNVTFLLNAMDSLAGDDEFVELRKRQPRFRRLERVDELTRTAQETRERGIEEASTKAERELEEAQKALDDSVEAIRNKEGLDETTKAIMLKSAESAENRRLKAKQERIERDKARVVAKTESEHRQQVDEVRNTIRLFAAIVPPIPALLLGGAIFARRRRREQESIPQTRRRDANGTVAGPGASTRNTKGGGQA